MKKESVLRNVIEMNIERRDVPTPETMIEKARKAVKKLPSFCAEDYKETIRELMLKRHCWSEITRWFCENGIDISYSSIRRLGRQIERELPDRFDNWR